MARNKKPMPHYIPFTRGLIRPKGLRSIIKTFGAISEMAQGKHLSYVELDYAIPLSWDLDTKVRRFLAHEKMRYIFEKIFNVEIPKLAKDLNVPVSKIIKDFGGCYFVRKKKGSTKYSTHSWGIAVDINVLDNPFGSIKSNQPEELVALFKKYGFIWGGDWKRNKDPMHFQFAEGY